MVSNPDETIAILKATIKRAVEKEAIVYVEDWIGSNEPWRELTDTDLLNMVRRCVRRGVRADLIENAIVKFGWTVGNRAFTLNILDSLPPGKPPEMA